MSQAVPQPAPLQVLHPSSQLAAQPLQRQEMMDIAEILGYQDVPPNPLPYPASALHSASPKPDASDLYLKSKALLDSQRKCAGITGGVTDLSSTHPRVVFSTIFECCRGNKRYQDKLHVSI